MWDGFPGIRHLSESHSHDFGSGVGEASLTHGRPPAQEIPFLSLEEIWRKCSRSRPVAETDAVVLGIAAHGYDEAGENQEDQSDDLDETGPELDFAQDPHAEDLRPPPISKNLEEYRSDRLTLIAIITIPNTVIQIATFKSGLQ